MNRPLIVAAVTASLALAACAAMETQPAATTQKVPPAWTPPVTLESVSIEPHNKIKSPRYGAPRLVYGADGVFFAEVPTSWNELVERKDSPLTVRVLVEQHATRCEGAMSFPLPKRDEDDAEDAAASAPASAPATAPASAPASRPARRKRDVTYRGEVTIDLKPLSDGPAKVTFTPSAATPGASAAPVTMTFDIIRERFGKVLPEHRAELATWLDDHNANRAIWGKVPSWRNLPAAIAQGSAKDPYADLRGFVLRSYDSPLLRRRQPYALYVPTSLDLTKPSPLLIVLHGSGGDYRNIVADEAAGQRFEKFPMLIANAGAHRHQEFRHLALQDVRSVLEDVSRKYNVDRSRVYLQGISLGGRGVLECAALMPEQFAAVSSQGSYGTTEDILDPFVGLRRDPLAAALGMRSDILTWLPNLRNTQVEFAFGWKDYTTLAANPLLLSQALRQHGAKPVERGFDTGHDISMPLYDWATTREWMLKQKTPVTPDVIHHRVSNLRFGKSYWITVDALQEYGVVGQVQAKYDAKAGRIDLQVVNVPALTLELPGPASTLSVNGQTQPLPPGLTKGHRIPLRLAPNIAAGKSSTLSGPLWDVFSTPVIYAYAAPSDEKEARRLRRSAERSAEWDMAWGSKSLLVKPASELTDADRKASSIIFFSSASSGKLTGVDSPPLPSGVSGNVTVALRPSPWAKDRYIVSVTADTPRPFSLHDLGWWDAGLQSDWIVGNLRERADGRGRRRSDFEFVAAGCYDGAWKAASFTRQDYRREMLLGPGASGD